MGWREYSSLIEKGMVITLSGGLTESTARGAFTITRTSLLNKKIYTRHTKICSVIEKIVPATEMMCSNVCILWSKHEKTSKLRGMEECRQNQ
jgi:hypothetical protein